MTRERARRGQRTGAALVAAFAAIGIAVAWLVAGAGVPEPVPVPESPVAGAAPASVAVGDERASSSPAANDETAARAHAPAALRSLRLRVQEELGRRRRSYAGPLRVAADGAEVLATTIANSLPLALDVPGDAASLRLEAPGFVACEVALDGAAGPGGIRDVVLVPDAGLHFCFVCRSGVGDASIRVQVFRSDVSAACEQRAHAGAADAVDLPMLRGEELRWCAQWQADGQWCEARGDEPPLASGEQRRVLVDFAAIRLQRHRVVGPSPALMPHLVVSWLNGNSFADLPLPADGTFERPAQTTSPVLVHTAGFTTLELREERAADAIVWRPPQPLLGVGLVDVARALVRTQPLHPSGHGLGQIAPLHVFARDALPRPLGLRAPGAPVLQFAIEADGANDLVLVTAADALAPTRLVVELSGEPPAERATQGLRLSVRGGDVVMPIERSASARVVFDLPRGGDYTLAWHCVGPGARDAAIMHVESGREQVATLAWPTVNVWAGEVAGYLELPAGRRWHCIDFGERGVGSWHLYRLDEQGQFRMVRFADDPPREPATLSWGLVPIAARVVACDDVRHHVVVQPGDVRWVDVDVEAPRPWRLVLFRIGADGSASQVHTISDRELRSVPIAGSTPLPGALFLGQAASPLAWCELRGDTPRATVRPEPLRRVEVRARTAHAGRQVFLVGPSGQWDLGHDLATEAPLVLDAPASTRGIGLANDGIAPREILLGADGVVWID